jgi:CubicO group peptidase (beta-lactamase class C family)
VRLTLFLTLLAAPLSAQAPWPTLDWHESTPESENVDPALLQAGADYLGRNMPSSYSLLVVRHGSLIFERYYGLHTRTELNNVKSISKSLLSALTGIAISEGYLHSVEDRVADYLPEYFNRTLDPLKHDIRLKHVLTMTSGLYWRDDASMFGPWGASVDPQQYYLSQPMVAVPGTLFNYSTALTHLLSGLLTRATGQSTYDYAMTRLLRPMGITQVPWMVLQGTYFGGSEVYLTARDLAKFGYLYLRQGRWEDRQLVPEAWVEESTTPKVDDYYGYLWWIDTASGHHVPYAAGYGSQHIWVIRDLDLVVVNTADSGYLAASGAAANAPYDVLKKYIVPAVQPDPPIFRPPARRPTAPEPRRPW